MLKEVSLLVAGLLVAGAAQAQNSSLMAGFSPIVTVGVTRGGDDWVLAKSASGATISPQVGNGLEIGGGVLWQSGDWPLALSATLNYHRGKSGGATIERLPLEAMAYYTGLKTLRFGVGLRYLSAPKIKFDLDGKGQTVDLKSGTGSMVEIGYEVDPKTWLNLRLASEKYKPKNSALQTADVSFIGLNLSHQF